MNLVRPQTVGVLAAIIILVLLVSLAQEMNRRLQVQHEVQRLQHDVQAMERNTVELKNLNQYFRTDDYQERLAREKLNYQSPGEKVVLIPDDQNSASPGQAPNGAAARPISIPERWWRVFFVPDAAAS